MRDRFAVGIGLLIATSVGIAIPVVAHAQPFGRVGDFVR